MNGFLTRSVLCAATFVFPFQEPSADGHEPYCALRSREYGYSKTGRVLYDAQKDAGRPQRDSSVRYSLLYVEHRESDFGVSRETI